MMTVGKKDHFSFFLNGWLLAPELSLPPCVCPSDLSSKAAVAVLIVYLTSSCFLLTVHSSHVTAKWENEP